MIRGETIKEKGKSCARRSSLLRGTALARRERVAGGEGRKTIYVRKDVDFF